MDSLRAKHIDWDLVERIEAGGAKPQAATKAKKKKAPRTSLSYRGAMRNQARADHWPAKDFERSRPQLHPIQIPLNRSRGLPFAATYARARQIAANKRAVGAV